MKLLIKKGATSVLACIFIQDSSSTIGAGLSGLTNASSGLICYRARSDDGNAAGTAISLASATLGTWTSAGFKEKDATNMKGVYEIGLTNASIATGSDYCILYFSGATNMAPLALEIQLVAFDPDDSVRLGLTALPNAAANAAGGLPVSTAGALDLDEMNVDIEAIQTSTAGLTFTGAGKVDASVRDWIGGTIPAVNVTGVPLVDLKYTLGTISPAAAGSVAIDWAQVSNKTSTVALTNTTVGTVTTVTNQLTAAAVATGVWQDTTAGDFTAANSVGKSVMNGVALGTGLTINAYTGNTVQTGDAYARLGAPVGASISADIAEVEGETDTLLAGVNVTQINGNATAAANVAHTNQALTRGTVGAASSTTSVTTSAITSPASLGASGQMIGRVILFDADTATANLQGQATNITANTTGATPTFTVTALTTAPASGDTFSIV